MPEGHGGRETCQVQAPSTHGEPGREGVRGWLQEGGISGRAHKDDCLAWLRGPGATFSISRKRDTSQPQYWTGLKRTQQSAKSGLGGGELL